MDGNAIIITGGLLHDIHAKTTHGLIRGTDRYKIIGVIDENHAGKDAGEVIDGRKKGIRVYSTIREFHELSPEQAKYCIIGVATKGGIIPQQMRGIIREAISSGLHIVNGLHEFLADNPDLVALAHEKGVELIDIRKPREKSQLKFWTGEIYEVKCPIIGVLGTDCAVGKRTTGRMMVQALGQAGISADMVFTGQTGWLCGFKYGFILDSTYNDFISGEMEHAIIQCYRQENPDVILLEGQSSLRNPSGPCGAEYLLSGNAKGVILVHPPKRLKFKGYDAIPDEIKPLEDEIELIGRYGSTTLGIALNTSGLTLEEARQHKVMLQGSLNLPVVLPIEEGVEPLVEAVSEYINVFANENPKH